MADEAPERSSQTEDPSQKKLDEAHRKGDVAKSQEVVNWFMLAGSALMFGLLAPGVAAGLSERLAVLLERAGQMAHETLGEIAQAQKLAAGNKAGQIGGQPPYRRRDRHIIVVQDHDEAVARIARVVHRLIGHAG